MSSKDLFTDSNLIETELNDILTLDSCCTLVFELIKFILYRKQQLPYTYDRLKYLIATKNSKQEKERTSSIFSSVERMFKVAESGFETLELLFEKTKQELAESKKEGFIKEVALLFGSTPMTPKQVYIIHLPEVCLDHSAINHPERKQVFHLLQSVILSSSLSNVLKKPMNPTNMFVFIKKNKMGYENNMNKWFIPKNRYQIPKIGQHFHIKFRQPDPKMTTCSCQLFQIYSDSEDALISKDTKNLELNKKENLSDAEWYQACAIFKGFRDVYLNGVSVADMWLR